MTYQSANPRDLISFRNSLEMLPHIKYILTKMHEELLQQICEELDTLEDLYQLLNESIMEEPPLAMKEGGIIKDGYDADVDMLRQAKTEGKNWLAQLEEEEREKTGIRN